MEYSKFFQYCKVLLLTGYSTSGGNVMKNMTQKDAELTFFTSPNNSESIRLTDVVIGVNEGKFYARNMVTGDYLIFRTGNMYNYMLTNNAIRCMGQQDFMYGNETDKKIKYAGTSSEGNCIYGQISEAEMERLCKKGRGKSGKWICGCPWEVTESLWRYRFSFGDIKRRERKPEYLGSGIIHD